MVKKKDLFLLIERLLIQDGTPSRFDVKFTEGSDYFDKTDINWYIGTYWGDVIAFKESLGLIKTKN